MDFAIMRCKKLTGTGNVAASLKHCFRERETANADAERTPDNEHEKAQSTDEAMGRMRALLPEKRRKDAVLVVEYLMTASPQWWKTATQEQQQQFFDKARNWLAEKYGADRIITSTIHRDETSPHLSAFVVPLTKDGRLCAKEFVGNRAQMKTDQTTFAKAVAHLGLERGIEGSKAVHTTISQYYTRISAKLPKEPAIAVPEPSMGERFAPQKYGERVAESVSAQWRPGMKVLAAKALEMDYLRDEKELYQSIARRAQLERDDAQAQADLKARKAVEAQEYKALEMQEEAVRQLFEEKRRLDQEREVFEQRLSALNGELGQVREALDSEKRDGSNLVRFLMTSPPEKVLDFVDQMKQRWQVQAPEKDRSDDLEI